MVPDMGPESNQSSGSDQQQNIWSSILKQVQTGTSQKLPSSKAVLMLGNNESGKTSLIAKMQGNDAPCKGSGLEYHHILVRDEYRDEHTKLGFWVLDGDGQHDNLLTFALNQETFSDITIVLSASMTTPWDLMDSLEKWANIIERHIASLNIQQETMKEYRSNVVRRFAEYISPGDEIEPLVNSTIKSTDLIENLLPDGVLTRNLGLDVVVVITKTDFMSSLEKDSDFKEETFDFIQQHVRKFCLNFGASLFYVSAKMNKNCDLLYKYLVHRIYGFPFKTPALVVEKDALFIPSGWDSEKKISILYDNIQSVSPDDPFEEVIVKNNSIANATLESEVVADDDQVFLTKMQNQLTQNMPAVTASPPAPSYRPSPTAAPKADRRSGASPGLQQIDPSKAGSPGGEGVLQNFFNSLLNRKSGVGLPNSPLGASPKSTNDLNSPKRVDVAAELDRMASGGAVNNGTPIKQEIEVTSQPPSE